MKMCYKFMAGCFLLMFAGDQKHHDERRQVKSIDMQMKSVTSMGNIKTLFAFHIADILN